ncbi:MAG: hypothetical protein K2F79_00205, partial [Muribaculaceae bacterium]|nr:hypothetical protein [Muribaculaceae bacterium]
MKNKIVLAALLASHVLFSQAATLPDNIMEFDTVMTRPCAMTLANPALSPLRHSVSLSSVAAGYTGSMLRQPAVSANGRGQRYGFFDASAYLRGNSSAITGHASYRNGRIYGITGTETLSPALIYPFFTVDEKGGDMNCETYSFGGSYASSVASKWTWGAQLD